MDKRIISRILLGLLAVATIVVAIGIWDGNLSAPTRKVVCLVGLWLYVLTMLSSVWLIFNIKGKREVK